MTVGVNGRFLAARPTGVQRVATELVTRLARRVDVTLRVPRRCPVPDRMRRCVDVAESRLGGRLWEQLELPASAGRASIELDPANAGPVWGGRRVLVLHDVLPLTRPEAYGAAFRLWFREAVGRSARNAAAVIMFSEWARREAIARLALDPERVTTIGQGVEPFDQPATSDEVRSTLARLGIRRPFVLGMGAGDPRKNAAFLEEVVAGLDPMPGREPLTLVLVGAPYPHVHATAPPEPRAGAVAVRRLGHVTDAELHALYTAARVFCFPSSGEGFGRPPLEAMACGAPVIAADYGAAAEILSGAAPCLPLEADAWRKALRDLLEDDAAAARASAAGRCHAARFRWDPAVDALLDACVRVAEAS